MSQPFFRNNVFNFNATNCANNQKIQVSVNALINTSGINYDLNQVDSPLIKNILKRKIAKSNHHGGLDMNFENFTIVDKLYALGDLTKGTHFITNSYLLCSKQASAVANHILNIIHTREMDRI